MCNLLEIRALHFGFWSGQLETNIQKFWPKKSTQDQYNEKNFPKKIDPIPIEEQFLGHQSTKDQHNIEKILWEDQYNTNTTKNGHFWTIFKKNPIF